MNNPEKLSQFKFKSGDVVRPVKRGKLGLWARVLAIDTEHDEYHIYFEDVRALKYVRRDVMETFYRRGRAP